MARSPGNSTTLSNSYSEQSGKSTVQRQKTTIVQKIDSLQKELADISKAELKEQALKKLIPEELSVLKC